MLAKKYRLPIQDWLKEKNKKVFIKKTDVFVVKNSLNNFNFSRFGVVISSKVSKSAVKRNKIKRAIFNFIRLHKLHESPRNDILIIVSPLAVKLPKKELENKIKEALARFFLR